VPQCAGQYDNEAIARDVALCSKARLLPIYSKG
jgi:hypothetical protein